MDVIKFLELASELGPYFVIMAFFVWRDYKREHRLEGRLDELNAFVRDELMEALKRNNEVLNKWTTPISRGPLNEHSTR